MMKNDYSPSVLLDAIQKDEAEKQKSIKERNTSGIS